MLPILLASYLVGVIIMAWCLWIVEEDDFNLLSAAMALLWPLAVVWITVSRLWEGK